MKKSIFLVIAVLAILAGCVSTSEVVETSRTPEPRTKLMVGFVNQYFVSSEAMEIRFFTFEGKSVMVYSPENPIVEGPDGISGLTNYLMVGTYGEQPIALVVRELGENWLLQEVLVDLGEDGILNWKISPSFSNKIA